ncbi:MAG: hypothetical protein HYY52_00920 [Candidatus Melainabacteria bacterium]|nr:hypothetical protein [Candidatus Melainabacteria bacterium]
MKDPYLKPVILGALLITLLSVIFAFGIILWAIVGGYVAVRLANKATKDIVSTFEGLFIGLLSGVLGGAFIDLLTVISFKGADNKLLLIRTLERSWPKDRAVPNFTELLPSIFLTTSVIVIIITMFFSTIGGYIGLVISRKKKKKLDF